MSFIKKKSYGQHFLHDNQVIADIAALVQDSPVLVEVGPGEGALTKALIAKNPEKLILCEADASLFEHLEEKFPQAELVKGDAARTDIVGAVAGAPWVCVGNLPYNAAAAIMSHVLCETPRPAQCIFMIQREQADRVCAYPGDMSMLSLAVQLYGEVRACFNVPPSAFTPPPKVDSTVIEILPYADANTLENEAILAFAQHGFNHRRKQLFQSLKKAGYSEEALIAGFEKLGLRKDIRPQDVSLSQWKGLFAGVAGNGDPNGAQVTSTDGVVA
jgi:16S rRNA (adenine1518-N6/adenine1519-N6)-dimethyltransferase